MASISAYSVTGPTKTKPRRFNSSLRAADSGDRLGVTSAGAAGSAGRSQRSVNGVSGFRSSNPNGLGGGRNAVSTPTQETRASG